MKNKHLPKWPVAGALLLASSLACGTVVNNTNPLPQPDGSFLTEITLVQHANVSAMASDFWQMGLVIWQLMTTDTISSNNWTNNTCSANAPHGAYIIAFAVDAVAAGTDNKLQKLMSLLQVSQLTGMQVTIMGAAITNDPEVDCTKENITHVYLRNTTY